jgi:hypothetical protein
VKKGCIFDTGWRGGNFTYIIHSSDVDFQLKWSIPMKNSKNNITGSNPWTKVWSGVNPKWGFKRPKRFEFNRWR